MESIRVTCLLDRSWDITAKEYIGTQKAGLLLDTASEEEDGKPVPTGIVLLDDGMDEETREIARHLSLGQGNVTLWTKQTNSAAPCSSSEP